MPDVRTAGPGLVAHGLRSLARALAIVLACAGAAEGQTTVPVIKSFTATPSAIRAGQSSTLSWTTIGATSVSIDQGIGSQPSSKTFAVTPSTTTTYTITASNAVGKVTSSVTVVVQTAPVVVIASQPSPMVQPAGVASTAKTTYVLSNVGGSATTITMGKSSSGTFFTQTPSSFTLPAGASQTITISATGTLAVGTFEAQSIPTGSGVAAGVQATVKLLSQFVTVSFGPDVAPRGRAVQNRIDVGGSSSPAGVATFTNDGGMTLNGVVTSDSPWLVPQTTSLSILPGATASVPFVIDRSKRPDAGATSGSVSGTLAVTYGVQSQSTQYAVPPVTTVTVVDTIQISTTTAKLPNLTTGEVAVFLAGIGRNVGTSGASVSDLALLNAIGSGSIKDLKLYFTAAGSSSSQVASFPALGNFSLSVADVVRKVFNGGSQVGSLQLRSADADHVLVTAQALNSSGGYGTAIPALRSDRAVASTAKMFLTGLVHDAVSHTDLFLQETAGSPVTVQTEFLAADGRSLGTRTDQLGAFGFTQIADAVPIGAVSAILSGGSGGGAFLGYATPVDELSGDTWSVADWSRVYGYAADDPVVIPLGGGITGRNGEYFRTNIAVMNTGATAAAGTLRFVTASTTRTAQVTLNPRQTAVLSNVASSLFGFSTDAMGSIVFTPTSGSFAVTSRLWADNPPKLGTYNAGVPVIAASRALRIGAVQAIGAIEDASDDTIVAERPATHRTNAGILEVSGNPVQVRITLRYSFSGSTTTASGTWSKDYSLAANQYLSLGSITRDVLGSGRDAIDDLRNVEADFQVMGGSGAAIFYTWTIDNGTADSAVQVAASNDAGDPTALCVASPRIACMLNNRMKATLRYRGAFDNNAADTDALVKAVTGFGSANYETSFFYFNSPNNIEILLKLLDQGNVDSQGRPALALLSGSATPLRTELTVTDTQSGIVNTYRSDFNTMKGTTDFTAFIRSPLEGMPSVFGATPFDDGSIAQSRPRAFAACVPDSKTACLLNGRFAATVKYRSAFDNSVADTAALLKPVTGFASATFETAFFYFNSANNIELLLKMLDQGNVDAQGHPTIAVLYGSATPLRIELTITDMATGAVKKYTSQFNSQSGGTDFTAFVK